MKKVLTKKKYFHKSKKVLTFTNKNSPYEKEVILTNNKKFSQRKSKFPQMVTNKFKCAQIRINFDK